MKKYLLSFLCLIAAVSSYADKTAKAVVSYDETTLTFYYDDADHSSEGIVCSLDIEGGLPQWSNYLKTITKAVFDESFKDARPESTRAWFSYMSIENVDGQWLPCFPALKEIKNIEYLNTSEVTDMSEMFHYCASLKTVDLSNFNTENVTDMSYMFAESCFESLDLSSFNTKSLENMSYMFYFANSLESLVMTNFKAEKVTNMSYAFSQCSALKSLDLSSFNTANVTDMNNMFFSCQALESLNVSSFNTANVTDMNNMFNGCIALKSLDLSSFNTVKVENMDGLFSTCTVLESIDMTNFNTVNAGSMTNMFYKCYGLETLDISSFNTKNVSSMVLMFYDCDKLKTVYVSENFVTTSVTDSYGMFANCKNIVGGNGTAFNSKYITATYAKIDGGENDPGYFTYKEPAQKLTIGESGYTTFCCTKNIDFSAETAFKAYIVTGYNKSTKVTTLSQVNEIPAGVGVLIIGTPGTYTLTTTTSAAVYSNFLRGVTEETSLAQTDGSYTNYVLSNGSDGYAFYKVDDDGGQLAAGKAYLSLPISAVAAAKVMRFVTDDEETTGIEDINTANGSGAVYNLAGQKVDGSFKGIVIKNGKKTIIR